MKNSNTDIQASNRIISIINNSKDQYERILSELENAYVVINDKFEILDANKRFASMIDTSFLRRDVFKYVYPGSVPLLRQEILNVIKNQQPSSIELKLISGRSFLFVISLFPVPRKEEGTIIKLLGADITELRERETLILDVFRTVTVGLLVVDYENKILNGFSQYSKIILEDSNLSGQDIFWVFFNKNIIKFSHDEMSSLLKLKDFNGNMPKDEFAALAISLPKMFEIPSILRPSGKRIIQVTYEGIIEDGLVIKYLMILQDMSDYVDINPPTLNDDLGKVFKFFDVDPETLISIFQDLQTMIERVPVTFEKVIKDELKGVLHSVKGLLRMVGINYLAGLVHQIEDQIKLHSKGQPASHQEVWSKFLIGWSRVMVIYRIVSSQFKVIPDTYKDQLSSQSSNESQDMFERFGFHPMLSPSMSASFLKFDGVSDLKTYCLRLIEKNSVDFNFVVRPIFESEALYLEQPRLMAIKTALLHLINNSFAHGFAGTLARTPSIKVLIERCGTKLVVNYSDNGGGVDLIKLRDRLKNSSGPSTNNLTDKQLANMIFLSGISTKDTVDEVSGRGVGLSGANTELESLGGNIELLSFTDGIHFKIQCPLLDKRYLQPEVLSSLTIEKIFEIYFPKMNVRTDDFYGLFSILSPLAMHQALSLISNNQTKELQIILSNKQIQGSDSMGFGLGEYLLSVAGFSCSFMAKENTLIITPLKNVSTDLTIDFSFPSLTTEFSTEDLKELTRFAQKLGVKIDDSKRSIHPFDNLDDLVSYLNRSLEKKAFLMVHGV